MEINANRYAYLLTTVFLLACGFAISQHEMWRDETQAWLLVRDSTSLIDLFRNLKYEGHQGLWHVILMPLTRLTASPVIMQAIHLLIATTTVYLVARYSPFSRLQKFLIAFGYFSFYEYAVVSRNYALGVLLITLFCIYFEKRYSRFLLVSSVLFLLAHTNPHCLIIAIIVSTALLLDFIYKRKRILSDTRIRLTHIKIGSAVIAIGIITAILQLIPPADSGYAIGWHWDYDTGRITAVINIIRQAFFPVPVPALHFWGTHWLEQFHLFRAVQTELSVLLLVALSLTLIRKPAALFIFTAGTTGLLLFFYVKYFGSMRHHGFLYVLLIMSAWLSRTSDPETTVSGHSGRMSRFGSITASLQHSLLTLILLFQFAGGIIAVTMDSKHVFSYGKATAEYIKNRNMQDMILVGDIDAPVSTVLAYLGKDMAHYLRADRNGSFVVWDKARLVRVPDEQVVMQVNTIADRHAEDVLLVMNRALGRELVSQGALAELESFTGSIVRDEDFYLYIARPSSRY